MSVGFLLKEPVDVHDVFSNVSFCFSESFDASCAIIFLDRKAGDYNESEMVW